MLIVFAGLPGTGKTTLARMVVDERKAVYLRIDTIEHALRKTRPAGEEIGPDGYLVAYALAKENLRQSGRTVVADAVNPLKVTRYLARNSASSILPADRDRTDLLRLRGASTPD